VNCLILKTTEATAEGIEAVEEDAEALWEAAATNVSTVAAHTVVPLGNVYKLVIDTTLPVNTFTITVAEEGAYVMFLQHDAVELEGLAGHYFTTGDGTPMDPLAVEVGGHHTATTAAPLSSGQITGLTVAATAVVASTSVVIFVLAMPVFHWARSSARMGAALNLINCFASGALLAASFLLIIPEAFVFIQSSELFWLRMLSVLPLYLNPQNTHSTRVTSLCPFPNLLLSSSRPTSLCGLFFRFRQLPPYVLPSPSACGTALTCKCSCCHVVQHIQKSLNAVSCLAPPSSEDSCSARSSTGAPRWALPGGGVQLVPPRLV